MPLCLTYWPFKQFYTNVLLQENLGILKFGAVKLKKAELITTGNYCTAHGGEGRHNPLSVG